MQIIFWHKKLFLFVLLFCVAIFVAFWLLIDWGQPQPKYMAQIDKLLQPFPMPSSNIPFAKRRIALLSILDRHQLIWEFQFALSTIRCYSLRHKYSHFVLISPNSTNQNCGQNDFMFRRHCFVADWMAKNGQFEWILFLDADIAVVNPHREVEEFIENDNLELIFIDRIFNSEIAAGSYLAKNTPFVRQFLNSWANFVLPSSFHGSDNGAIHALFMKKYAPWEYQNECQHLWESSKNFGDLNVFEICVRHFIEKQTVNGTFDGGKVKIMGKGRGWFRDGGHTGSRFSSRDFMLHGWKNSTFNKNAFNPWKNPFSPGQHFDIDEFCANGSEWEYENEFVANEEEIEQKLQKIIHKTKKQYLNILNELKLNKIN